MLLRGLQKTGYKKNILLYKWNNTIERANFFRTITTIQFSCFKQLNYNNYNYNYNQFLLFTQHKVNFSTEEKTSSYKEDLAADEAYFKQFPDKIDEHYNKIKSKTFIPANTYLLIIHCLLDSGQISKTPHYIKQMQARNVDRTAHIFEVIIKKSVLINNINIAHEIYLLMKEDKDVTLSPLALKTLIGSKRRDEKIFQYYKDMKNLKIPLDEENYCDLILSTKDSRNNKKIVMDLYNELIASGIPFTYSIYSAIFAVINANDIQSINYFFSEMKKYKIEFNLSIVNSLLQTATAEVGRNLYDQLTDLGAKPSLETFEQLICSCSIAKNSDLARFYYKELSKYNYYPSRKFLLEFMATYCAKGDSKIANSIYKKCIEMDIIPIHKYYHQLIESCIPSGNSTLAEEYFQEMIKYKQSPNSDTYSKLISVCVKNADINRAKSYFQRLLKEKIPSTVRVINSLLEVFLEGNDLPSALHYLGIMKSNNILPNSVTQRLMLQLSIKAKDINSTLNYYSQYRTFPYFTFEQRKEVMQFCTSELATNQSSSELNQLYKMVKQDLDRR